MDFIKWLIDQDPWFALLFILFFSGIIVSGIKSVVENLRNPRSATLNIPADKEHDAKGTIR